MPQWSTYPFLAGRNRRCLQAPGFASLAESSGDVTLEIGKVQRVEVVDEVPRPVIEHISDRHVVGNAEGEVQIREAVAAVQARVVSPDEHTSRGLA